MSWTYLPFTNRLKYLFIQKTSDSFFYHLLSDFRIRLVFYNIINAGVTSPFTLYDEEVATFDADEVYNQSDAEGFINLFGLPIQVKAKLDQKRNNK